MDYYLLAWLSPDYYQTLPENSSLKWHVINALLSNIQQLSTSPIQSHCWHRCINVALLFLGRVALGASAAAHSHQTFPWTICRSVHLSVCPSVCLSSTLWKNGRSDLNAVWHRRLDGSRDEAGGGVWRSVHGNGYFWGEFWAHHGPRGPTGRTGATALRPPCQIALGRFVFKAPICKELKV